MLTCFKSLCHVDTVYISTTVFQPPQTLAVGWLEKQAMSVHTGNACLFCAVAALLIALHGVSMCISCDLKTCLLPGGLYNRGIQSNACPHILLYVSSLALPVYHCVWTTLLLSVLYWQYLVLDNEKVDGCVSCCTSHSTSQLHCL